MEKQPEMPGMPQIASLPTDAQRAPQVHIRDGEVFASSRDVAAYFGKDHRHVLRDIDNLLAQKPDLGLSSFGQTPYVEPSNGQTYRSYEMDRKGFTLLAMGFTGSKALQWKVAYIDAFDLMEAQVRKPQVVIDPSDPKVVLACMQHLQNQIAEKEAVIAVQAEGIKTLGRLEGAHGSMCITDAAKTLGVVPHNRLFKLMESRHWIYKRPGNASWLAYSDKITSGLMEHDDHLYIDSQQRERVSTRALVTAKGLVKLADLLNERTH